MIVYKDIISGDEVVRGERTQPRRPPLRLCCSRPPVHTSTPRISPCPAPTPIHNAIFTQISDALKIQPVMEGGEEVAGLFEVDSAMIIVGGGDIDIGACLLCM